MTEYIDKTEAMRRFKPFGREIPKEQVMAVLARIDEGIVRCKECRHLYNDADTGKACEFTNMGMKPDDFCSYGEKERGMKRKDALWVMQMCRDRDARSEAEREAFDTAIEALKSESIFTADRPRGEWIETEFLKLKECSCCHQRWGIYSVEEFDFCPTCGADMRGDGK